MSSIIKCGPSPSKLAFQVDWKMADIISPLPGCSKRKSGKSISVEEQQIILNTEHLWRLLKKMGFGYEKRGRQRTISERREIIARRERYLRRIRKIREADPERAIVYADETWLNQGHRTKKEWVDLETLKEKNLRSLRLSGLTVGCTKELTGKGRRLIISDAMTESGPVRGALWMFKADGKGKKEKN